MAKHVLASFLSLFEISFAADALRDTDTDTDTAGAVSYLRYYLTAAGLSQERGRGLVYFGMQWIRAPERNRKAPSCQSVCVRG